MRVGEQAAQRARVEATPADGKEERVLCATRELRATVAEVARHQPCGLLAERDDPLLAALPADVYELLVEIEVREVEVDRLLRAQAGRVDELHQRLVPGSQRPVAAERVELAVELVRAGRLGQPPRPARGERRIGHTFGPQRVAQERPHGRELPADRRRRKPARPRSPELGGVVGEHAHVHVVQPGAAPLEPARELAHIDPVGSPRRRGKCRARQKPLDLLLHGRDFAAGAAIPLQTRDVCHPRRVEREPVVYLITGPMAAGKSTVARLLAMRFERGVHLDGDAFRRSIVSGREEMTPDPSPEALEQLLLRYRLAAAAADTYFDAGFGVALEDVVAGPLLGDYRTMIRSRPCHVIVLLPSLHAVAAREAGRDHESYGAWTVEQFYEGFVATTPRVGIWLDTSDLTPEETVDEILARTASARTPIVVADYDEEWPALFEQLARPIREAVADLGAEIEHIGSTSVPGLAAKPVIDIDVVVRSADDVPVAIERLRSLGYVYQGDKGIRGREAFLWPPDARQHHLYVVVAGSRPHAEHIRFRDYLWEHPDVAQEYAELKTDLAEQHRDDGLGYTDAKSEFVAAVLRRTTRG